MKHLASLFLLLTAWAAAPLAHAQRANTALNMTALGRWQNPDTSVFYNDLWAYVDSAGREYAIVGSSTGTNFIDVTDPRAPRLIDFVEGRINQGAIWRDYKTYSHYAYAVADGSSGNSLQVFDLQYLPDSVHLMFDDDSLSVSAHTCFVDEGKLYLVNNKRFWTTPYADVDVFSLANPARPRYLSTINLPQNVPSTGGHAASARRDTLYVSGGYGGMFVYDMRNPLQPALITRFGDQTGSIYNHTSWTTTNNHFLVMEEEVPQGRPLQFYDITDLQNPLLLSEFNSQTHATPHNPFIVQDRYVVSSWYQDGLQVWDLQNPAQPVRIGYYDTYPDNDSSAVPFTGQGYDGYEGCWGAYPFLPSGNLLASDITYGLFVLSSPINSTGLPHATPTAVASLAPNPTTGTVRLQLAQPANRLTVEVINAIGQRVRPAQVLTGNSAPTISLAELPAGVYFLRLTADGNAPVVRRVVKQ
jgi:choice-of-anchor B domain-containing protein